MMNKKYIKPDVEFISLVAEEQITDELIDGLADDFVDGEMGLESSIFD